MAGTFRLAARNIFDNYVNGNISDAKRMMNEFTVREAAGIAAIILTNEDYDRKERIRFGEALKRWADED